MDKVTLPPRSIHQLQPLPPAMLIICLFGVSFLSLRASSVSARSGRPSSLWQAVLCSKVVKKFHTIDLAPNAHT